MTTSQTPEEPMTAFEEAVKAVLADIKQRVPVATRHYVLTDAALEQVMAVAQELSDQRAQLAHKLTQEADKDIAKNAYYRGKSTGVVVALDELKRDVMAVASKYDDETNTIWLGNINRIRAAALALPTGNAGKTEEGDERSK